MRRAAHQRMTLCSRWACTFVCLLGACESGEAVVEHDAAKGDAANEGDASSESDAAHEGDAASVGDAAVPGSSCRFPWTGDPDDSIACQEGFVCHLDDTCVEAGASDAHGVQPLFESMRALGTYGIAGYTVHEDTIYWGDTGRFTPNNDPLGDDSFHVFDLESFEDTRLSGQGGAPRVDGDRLYIERPEGLHLRALNDPQIDLHLLIEPKVPSAAYHWVVHRGTVYYFYRDELAIHRWTEAAGDEVLVEVEGIELLAMIMDGERLLVEVLVADDVTQLIAIDPDGTSSIVLENFRTAFAYGGLFIVAGDRVISTPVGFTQLQQHDLASGEQSFIPSTEGTSVGLHALHEGQLYFVVYEGTTQENRTSTLKRIPVEGGQAETLYSSTSIQNVTVHGGYLYWVAVDGHLLVRKAL
jgi:hypothetical protein